MSMVAGQARVTSLLSNELLRRLEKMRIHSSRRFTSRGQGEHLWGRGGNSTEFSDYRDYAEGDDTRFIDWNIFSRLRRPYLKLYRMEEQMHLVLLVDGSSSMLSEGKFEVARQLAAALGVMGLVGVERVSAYGFRERQEGLAIMPVCSGRGHLRRLLWFLENLQGGGDMPLEVGVEAMLKRHRGKGVAVVLSDFLTPADLQRAFNLLHSASLEVFAIQILSPAELEPAVQGDLRLVDSETAGELDITSSGELLEVYQEYRQALTRRLESLVRRRGGRFMGVSSQTGVETLVLDSLRRKGWVR